MSRSRGSVLPTMSWVALGVVLGCADGEFEQPACTVGRSRQTSCTTRQLPVDAEGRVPCRVYAPVQAPEGRCDCSEPGYAATDITAAELWPTWYDDEDCTDTALPCVCEILQLEGDALRACQAATETEWQRDSGNPVGWCYIDPMAGVGELRAVSQCQRADARRVIRVLGAQESEAALVCLNSQ